MYSICLLYVNISIVHILFFNDITFLNATCHVLHDYYMRTSAVTLFIFTLQYLLSVYIHVYFTLGLFEVEFTDLCFSFAYGKVFL